MLLGGANRSTATATSGGTSSRARALIDEAAERWRAGGFPPVPGETEFIPLPEDHRERVTFVP